ncbi:MAG TPA: ABC transporter permease [Gemmatimonadaceae bacterium]|nr:ABC transporter permease [Gemmatimonadaceae bacterium]
MSGELLATSGAFLEATVRTATPLALAALGETVTERAGIINIGLEGVILAGAFGALLGGYPVWLGAEQGSVLAGFAAAISAGVLVAMLFAVVTVRLRADQIIAGTAINLLALGATGALYRGLYGETGAALSVPTTGPIPIPLLSDIPLVGRALFAQPAPTYALYLLVPLAWWWLYRTHAGLALRAVGESPEAASVAGILPERLRMTALLVGGALGGASGGTLVLAQSGTFAEGMSAGRGFIAIAIVVLGRWNPVGAALAALLFGAASALQFLFQATGWGVPYQLPLALPYLLTLAALAVRRPGARGRRALPPAALGQS